MSASDTDRTLTPIIGIVLEEQARPLAPALLLAMIRRSAPATRLATTIDAVGRVDDLPRLFRVAVERVTRLTERNAALLAGYTVRDEIALVLTFTLGGEHPAPGELRRAVECLASHQLDFYRGTRVHAHAVVLLPDLQATDRSRRYGAAFAQLCELERAMGDSAPRLQGRPFFAHRWLLDCRTGVGAHAGQVTDVLEPLSEFLALLAADPRVRELDGRFQHHLYGNLHGQLTGYSSPGYAEVRYQPTLLLRAMACRPGTAALERVLRPEADVVDARSVEKQAEETFGEIGLSSIANRLMPRGRGGGVGDTSGRSDYERHSRQRARKALHDEAESVGVACAKRFLDTGGLPAAVLLSRSLRRPLHDLPQGEIFPAITLRGVEGQARDRVLRLLSPEIRRLREVADALQELSEEDRQALAAEYAMITARQRAASHEWEAPKPLRLEPAALREEARRLEALVKAHNEAELDELEAELHRQPRILPLVPPPNLFGGRIRRLSWRMGRTFRLRRAPPIAGRFDEGGQGVGPSNPRLLAEWLRWLLEFHARLERIAEALTRFEAELRAVHDYYAARARELIRELTVSRPFSHRLLSGQRLEEVFADRSATMQAALDASGLMPWSIHFRLSEPPLELLQYPLNARFPDLDTTLDRIAAEHQADWRNRELEELIFDDPEISTRGSPVDRMRALRDAAAPLARPEDRAATPARTRLILLPRERATSRLPALDESSGRDPAELERHADACSVVMRTALHGFAASALKQLRPMRELYLAAEDGTEPPPDPSDRPHTTVDEPTLTRAIALGLAFGRIAHGAAGLELEGMDPCADEELLVHRFLTTFAGAEAALRLRRQNRCDLALADAADRLREALSSNGLLDTRHRAALESVLAELEVDRGFQLFPPAAEE
jgi:hypothetical protein